jgi:hypothetical protein
MVSWMPLAGDIDDSELKVKTGQQEASRMPELCDITRSTNICGNDILTDVRAVFVAVNRRV